MSLTVLEGGELGDSPAPPVILLPLRFADGAAVTAPQGSTTELRQAVELVLTTAPGERTEEPDFGSPSFLLRSVADLDAQELIGLLAEQEPRASVDVTIDEAGAQSHITVTVSTEES